ncbi:MAG: prepilin-type N-terminal cleavage/methylation domain-containing protein [Burkholderiales bacterium]|nr:prepilin-type N-terminal cleavage/methylation domain-containing protein [Burkholderiales bacterium]
MARNHIRRCASRPPSARGFTLIELLVAMAIAAILAAVALPSYNSHVQRSRVPAALDGLSSYAVRMEQRFQDVGNYANAGACAVAVPAVSNFTVTCAISGGGTGFTATATGSGVMSGYTYTINHQGARNTTAHPKGTPATACWSTRGGTCDT